MSITLEKAPNLITEHQQAWWGTQPCRRCNPHGLPDSRPDNLRPACFDCDGSGWTVWAAMATEPWSEIVPNLWIGGHDYNVGYNGSQEIVSISPENLFDTVVSMYHRDGFEPSECVQHHQVLFPDAELVPEVQRLAEGAARVVADNVLAGRKVLARCQAGLNRSSLVAGLAMTMLGYSGPDAVQLIRSRRSPWALCNEDYAVFISGRVQQEGA